ncbi:unnamed protein product [Paramecium octaurelia]|uniref:Transmembrane protein n=1 Tax=Paramecium octaurelia TaxID=43137 RepID=A0A8S1UI36_PAROT|nr:unnamed protein product [Paramecium octaurelia]
MIALNFIKLQTAMLFLCQLQKIQAYQETHECQNIILKQNEKLCELREISTFFIGQKSDNLTNINTLQQHEDLIQVSSGPIIYSKDDKIISIYYRELIDANEICSLIYNPKINEYSIKLISTETTYIIDSKMTLKIKSQINILIQTESNFNCTYFYYNTKGFIVFCHSIDSLIFYQLQKEEQEYKQSIIHKSEILNLSCSVKFQQLSNQFLIIYCQCQEWIIYIYDDNSIKLYLDQNILREKYNVEGILLDVITCQSNIVLLLSTGGYSIFQGFFTCLFYKENLNLNEILIYYNMSCQIRFALKSSSQNESRSTFPFHFNDLILNTTSIPKSAFLFNNPISILLWYHDQLLFQVNSLVNQAIKIKIQRLIQLSNNKLYIGMDEENQITLFQITYSKPCMPYYGGNQNITKYYLQFLYTANPNVMIKEFFHCYKPIIIENEEQKKEYAVLFTTSYEESFIVQISTSSIQSIYPYKMNFRSQLTETNIQLKNNQIQCRFNQYLKNYKGRFIIKTKNQEFYSIIVQGLKNQIKEYSCFSSQDFIYHNMHGLDEQILHRFQNLNVLIFLDKQRQCLYRIHLDEDLKNDIINKIVCLDSKVEKMFGVSSQIVLKLKDQEVFYNLFSNIGLIQVEKNLVLSQLKNKNVQDIFQINADFYGVLYENQLHLVYKQVTVQIINITAIILGFLVNSQTNLLSSLVLIDLKKNELQFYVVQLNEFIQIRNYNLENYVPVQPPSFKIFESKIIISCYHKINKRLYLLIFNSAFQSSLHFLQKVIEISNQNFWVYKFYVYYYDDKNQLAVYDTLHIILEIQNLGLNNQISQKLTFQVELDSENIETAQFKKDITISLINPRFLKLRTVNYTLSIKNDNQVVNFRNFILGQIDDIILPSTKNFILRYPLEKEVLYSCSYYCSKLCFQGNNSDDLTFFQIDKFQQNQLVYNLQKYLYNPLFVEAMKEDLFLFINQISNLNIMIQVVLLKDNLFRIKKQLDVIIFASISNIQLKQNILIIETSQYETRFLINDHGITQVESQGQIYHINQNMYIEIMANVYGKVIIINLLEISNSEPRIQGTFEILVLNTSMKNLFLEQGFPILLESIKLIKKDYNQNEDQLNLMLFIISRQTYDVQFQVRLYLKEQKYEFINHKILRCPKTIKSCIYVMLTEEEIILDCGLKRYFYDMQNSDYLFDPIYTSKSLDQIDILNSTHYLFVNYCSSNQSYVLSVGKRGGYRLQKLTQNYNKSMSLELQFINDDIIEKNNITFNLQVIQTNIELNEFSQLTFVILIMIFMIFLVTIGILYRQCTQRQLRNVIKTEISLVEINMRYNSKI